MRFFCLPSFFLNSANDSLIFVIEEAQVVHFNQSMKFVFKYKRIKTFSIDNT